MPDSLKRGAANEFAGSPYYVRSHRRTSVWNSGANGVYWPRNILAAATVPQISQPKEKAGYKNVL